MLPIYEVEDFPDDFIKHFLLSESDYVHEKYCKQSHHVLFLLFHLFLNSRGENLTFEKMHILVLKDRVSQAQHCRCSGLGKSSRWEGTACALQGAVVPPPAVMSKTVPRHGQCLLQGGDTGMERGKVKSS